MKLAINIPSAEDEFAYLSYVISKGSWYTSQGYPLNIPDHDVTGSYLEGKCSRDTYREYYGSSIYDVNPYILFQKTIENHRKIIEDILCTIRGWGGSNFKTRETYTIVPTLYGPGGSYNCQRARITLRCSSEGKIKGNIIHKIIHEIIHMCVEEPFVLKFQLDHWEKEALVDGICSHFLREQLLGYRIQERCNIRVLELVSSVNKPSELSKALLLLKHRGQDF